MLQFLLHKGAVVDHNIDMFVHSSYNLRLRDACIEMFRFIDCSWLLLQVKFTFDEAGLHLHYPAAYTVCAQGLANGSYLFPAAQGNAWLSARPHASD